LFHGNRPVDVLAQRPSECFPGIPSGRKLGRKIGRGGCNVVYGNGNGRNLFAVQIGCKDQESQVDHYLRYPGNGFAILAIAKSWDYEFRCCSHASDCHDCRCHTISLFDFRLGFGRTGDRVLEFKQICRECAGPHDRHLRPCLFQLELALSFYRQHGPVGLGWLCIFFRRCKEYRRLKYSQNCASGVNCKPGEGSPADNKRAQDAYDAKAYIAKPPQYPLPWTFTVTGYRGRVATGWKRL